VAPIDAAELFHALFLRTTHGVTDVRLPSKLFSNVSKVRNDDCENSE
jgi:hypothetical protein